MSAIARIVHRRWRFAAIAMLLSAALTTGLLLGADLYLHHRAGQSAGLNRWGYRGPVAGRKQPGETRTAMLGGSTVFGYGVYPHQTIPAVLERELQSSSGAPKVTVVNLGFNNEGVHALEPTLKDFDHLQIDIAVFYPGYNDFLGDLRPNTAVYRHKSPIFRMFGYYPILPLILEEKAIAIRSGGQLSASNDAVAAGAPRPVFTPGIAGRASATAMETANRLGDMLSAQLDRLSPQPPPETRPSEAGCRAPWVAYCDALHRAVVHGRAHGMKILVAMPPVLPKDSRVRHLDQQAATVEMVRRRFQHDPHVRLVDLSRTVDLEDRHVSFDEMHLDQDGNAIVARALAPHVLALIGS